VRANQFRYEWARQSLEVVMT